MRGSRRRRLRRRLFWAAVGVSILALVVIGAVLRLAGAVPVSAARASR